jgi:hypothetical protein
MMAWIERFEGGIGWNFEEGIDRNLEKGMVSSFSTA